jgi:uncharacterized protein (DUF1778 family)
VYVELPYIRDAMGSKTERLEVRLSAEHKAVIEEAAALRGQSISAFVVSQALEQALRLRLTVLSQRDWDRFLKIMDRTEPAPSLVAAARKHRRGS